MLASRLTCPRTRVPQVAVESLIQRADFMFPEGLGRRRAAAKLGAPAPFINALVVNTKGAIDALWKQSATQTDVRGRSPVVIVLARRRTRSDLSMSVNCSSKCAPPRY